MESSREYFAIMTRVLCLVCKYQPKVSSLSWMMLLLHSPEIMVATDYDRNENDKQSSGEHSI
jgi:hypothetical protein